jgi:hypothetical protein
MALRITSVSSSSYLTAWEDGQGSASDARPFRKNTLMHWKALAYIA